MLNFQDVMIFLPSATAVIAPAIHCKVPPRGREFRTAQGVLAVESKLYIQVKGHGDLPVQICIDRSGMPAVRAGDCEEEDEMAADRPTVTDRQVDEFQRDGVLLLRGVFADWVDDLRRGMETNMAAPSWRERSIQPADGTAPFFQDFCNWDKIPEYNRFVTESPAASVAGRLMRAKAARLFHEHILIKEPGSSVVTPWHHDMPYYCVEQQP